MNLSVISIPNWDSFTKSVADSSLKKEEIRVYILHSPDCPIPDCKEKYLLHAQAHLLTRKIISVMEGLSEDQISLKKGPHGKPFLPGSDLSFSLTHSGEWVAACFSRDYSVGIDLEHKRLPVVPNNYTDLTGKSSKNFPDEFTKDLAKKERLIRRFFHPHEVAVWEKIPVSHKLNWFYRYWTMKEALLKGTGTGLSVPTDSFCLLPGEHCRSGYWTVKSQNSSDTSYRDWLLCPLSLPSVPAPEILVGSLAFCSRSR